MPNKNESYEQILVIRWQSLRGYLGKVLKIKSNKI